MFCAVSSLPQPSLSPSASALSLRSRTRSKSKVGYLNSWSILLSSLCHAKLLEWSSLFTSLTKPINRLSPSASVRVHIIPVDGGRSVNLRELGRAPGRRRANARDRARARSLPAPGRKTGRKRNGAGGRRESARASVRPSARPSVRVRPSRR